MNKQGWLTRSAETVGGEGQTRSTLEEAEHVPAEEPVTAGQVAVAAGEAS